MSIKFTRIFDIQAQVQPAMQKVNTSRRGLVKGLGAILGLVLVAGPAVLFSSPVKAAQPQSAAEIENEEEPIGSVKMFSGDLPQGWVACDGRLYSISQNMALFTVLGNTYTGGDGTRTFAIPDLHSGLADDIDGLPRTQNKASVRFSAAIKIAPGERASAAVCNLRLPHHVTKVSHKSVV